jgi:endonuclease/exonuclease/phosphatase (EEP) superfamily protein YafD
MTLLLLVGFTGWMVLAAVSWGFGGAAWWLDLPNHGPQYTLGVAAAGVLLAVVARFRRLALLFTVVGFFFALRWAWVVGPSAPPASPVGVRVLLANVYSNNTDTAALLALIESTDPDIIGLMEVNDRWLSELEPLRNGWPAFVEMPRRDNFGIALYSRVPGSEVSEVVLGGGQAPSLTVQFADEMQVILTHPLPPLGGRYSTARNEQLADVAHLLESDAVVVMGDFNATPWSHHFPAPGAAVAGATWPSGLPALLRVPIDHIVGNRAVQVSGLRVGPHIGSDHRPVLGVISRHRPTF